MPKRYPQVYDGDWVRPVMRGYKMRCCDCGLVHRFNFKVIKWGRGHKVLLQPFRDERATAAGRRGRKKGRRRAPSRP